MTPIKHPRGLFTLVKLAAMAMTFTLAACGGGGSSSTPVAPPAPTVSISLTPASVIMGQASTLTWSATNATSCTASGVWAGTEPVSGTISTSQATAGTYTYSLSCTGPSGAATGSATLAVTTANNVASLVIDSGPTGGGVINVPYVSVTICRPGTTTCQTIDHIMIDTASFGLRIIAPGILNPSLALPSVTNVAGNSVGECAQFVSGFTWGSVRSADVKLGGEIASSIPIEEVSDTSGNFSNIPSNCSSAGANIGTVAALGANGILGVGVFNQDCGPACVTSVIPGTYYGCTSSSCTGTKLPLVSQVSNPVSAFSVDNNGVLVSIPSVPANGSTTVSGALIFGVGTQLNNQIGSAVRYMVNSEANFTTTYKGTALASSFLDTGSNGLFFPDNSIASCTDAPSFFCPPQTLALTAVNAASDGSASSTVAFTIDNFDALGSTIRAASIGGNTASVPGIAGFDWGLPFFFGRPVFVAIEGMSTPVGTGPFWAY